MLLTYLSLFDMIQKIKLLGGITLKSKRYSIRLNGESLIEFAEKQGNFTDTIKYLIEKEIFQNGIRDLQTIIPTKRSDEYFKNGGINK